MGFVENQLDVQRNTYKIDPPNLKGLERARFLWDNVAAAKEELSEIRRCFDAKVYTGLTHYTGEILPTKTRDDVLGELSDLLCFVGNICSMEQISTDELERAHMKKVEQNRIRHAR